MIPSRDDEGAHAQPGQLYGALIHNKSLLIDESCNKKQPYNYTFILSSQESPGRGRKVWKERKRERDSE